MSALELDRLHRSVLVRIFHSSPPRKAGFLKSRLALIAVLATGVLMSGTGATMAVTGLAGDGDASVSQYGAPGSGKVLGDSGAGDKGDPSSGGGDKGADKDGGVLGNQESGGDDPASSTDSAGSTDPVGSTGSGNGAGTQATKQVAKSTDPRLPFTGLAVFPLLIGGVALLITGAAMQRKTRPSRG